MRKKRSIIYPMKEWAAGGSKTAAGITEKINSLDPLLRSYMGPFIFGDSNHILHIKAIFTVSMETTIRLKWVIE